MAKFQASVLELVSKVPKGKVTTYKELARALGRPRAWRAVANALAKNPSPVKIPCHRVIRSDGKVGGYKLGGKRKAELLLMEGIAIKKGKVDFKKFFKVSRDTG
ncbi:MAG: methylated-DNA--[protein]-cysteine S-methyltransferase [Hadesarchaea archaeon]|nr:methylated-DNA--[protein]-cysteine S-methyltransferase [Hadesarchaea archaeon]